MASRRIPAVQRRLVAEAVVRSERTVTSVAWEFRPVPRAERRRAEEESFHERLAATLRAGHGLAASFALRLTTGAEPRLLLSVGSSPAHRWVDRTLTRIYGTSQWRRTHPSSVAARGGPWVAARAYSWPQPLRAVTDGAALTDVLALSAATVAPGAFLEFELTPLPDPGPSWWQGVLPRLPASPTPARGWGRPHPARAPEPARSELSDVRPVRPLFWALRATIGAEDPDRSPDSLRTVVRAFERASRGNLGNGLVFRPLRSFQRWWARDFPVSEEELVLLLPGPECPCGPARPRPTPGGLRLAFGRSRAGTVVGPEVEPDQGRHLAVLGETGMGKSSLLVSLSVRTSRNAGLVLFDPLGETAEAFLQEIAATSEVRPIRIDPEHSPLRTNALEGVGPSEGDAVRSERRLNDLVHAFRRVRAGRYVDSSYWGPRIEEMLTRALSAAAAFPHGTLTDAHTLLATGARLHRDLPSEAMGPVRELGDRIREHPQDAEGARRLLYEVVRSPVLERMLCAREPELLPGDLVAPGTVVVLSGNASRVGESTARYLLSTYLALLWSELLSRRVRSKTFIVLDEAQWFSHESLAEMLRLGRRANVHVVLATQAVASLPESVREAVWTNVADFVAFRGSPDEAREFSRVAHGLPPEEILSLPRGQAAVLLGKGEAVEWVHSARLPGSAELPDGRRRLGPGLSPGDETPSRPESGPLPRATRGPPREPSAEVDHEEEVFRRLRALAGAAGAGTVLRVPLCDLRPDGDTDGRAVRSAGSRLGRSGALLGVERTDRGRVWVLAIDRIPPPRGPASTGEPSGAAGPPKLS